MERLSIRLAKHIPVILPSGSGTGASGIGRGICLVLAEQEANIVVADLNSQEAEAVASEIAVEGHQSVAVSLDVTDRGSVSNMVAQVLDQFGQIDILGFLVGGIVGTVVGILIAPQSGAVTRADLAERSEEWRRRGEDLRARVSPLVETVVETVREAVEEAADEPKDPQEG